MSHQQIPENRRKAYGLIACTVYLAFTAVAGFLLPAKFASDSNTMIEGAQSAMDLDASYQRISDTIGFLGFGTVLALVIILGTLAVWFLVKRRATSPSLLFVLFSLIAAIPLNFVRPQKELYVLLLTALVLIVLRRGNKHRYKFALMIVPLYIFYALFAGRSYYLLIILVFSLLFIARSLSREAKLIAVIAAFVGGFAIPNEQIALVQASRDVLNEVRILDPTDEGNRTAFINPIEEPGWGQFLVNYGYAAVRLNIPILFSIQLQELFLTFFMGAWMWLTLTEVKSNDIASELTSKLLISHMLVLWIFEPDLGSYLRHMSSLVLYLDPLLIQLDRRSSATLLP